MRERARRGGSSWCRSRVRCADLRFVNAHARLGGGCAVIPSRQSARARAIASRARPAATAVFFRMIPGRMSPRATRSTEVSAFASPSPGRISRKSGRGFLCQPAQAFGRVGSRRFGPLGSAHHKCPRAPFLMPRVRRSTRTDGVMRLTPLTGLARDIHIPRPAALGRHARIQRGHEPPAQIRSQRCPHPCQQNGSQQETDIRPNGQPAGPSWAWPALRVHLDRTEAGSRKCAQNRSGKRALGLT